jgi:predicted TIM-barrel fold metal-dependent hydrolase
MTGAAGLVFPMKVLRAQAPQPATKVSFPVPDSACDCHVHVFGDPARYPFVATRVYTPEPASIADLRTFLDALQMDRVVIVQPSVYGTDNRCTLDAIQELKGRARGVAVIDASTTDAALDAMARAGIRGIRLNLTTAGVSEPSVALQAFRTAVERVRARDWHIQLNAPLHILSTLSPQLLASPVPLVIDHFGGALASAGLQQPGFDALVALVKSGTAYVKVSGAADLISTQAPEYADVSPLAKALIAANPERILWGSNWPHPDSRVLPGRKNTDIAPPLRTDDGRVLNLLATWVPDAAVRRTILVDNPARLYEF